MIKTCHPQDEIGYLRGVLQMLPVKGEAAEIGVWNGGTAKVIQEELGSTVHLFDTFEGIKSEHAEENWPAGEYRCSIEEVKRNVGEGFVYHKGDIIETMQEAPKKLSFVHFDLDVYEPLSKALPFFHKQLAKGGVMMVSNYDDAHPGVVRAVNEFGQGKHYSRYVLYGTS